MILQLLVLTLMSSDTPCCSFGSIYRLFKPLPEESVQSRLERFGNEIAIKEDNIRGSVRFAEYTAPRGFHPNRRYLQSFEAFLNTFDGFKDLMANKNPVIDLMKAAASFRSYASENFDFQKERNSIRNCDILKSELKTARIHNTVIGSHALVEMSTHLEKFFPEDNDFENYTNYELQKKIAGDADLRMNVAKFAVFLYTLQLERGGPYRRINEALKSGTRLTCGEDLHKTLKREATIVHYGFYHLRRQPEFRYVPGTEEFLWRGMQNMSDEQFEKFRSGTEYTWMPYISATKDIEQAKQWTNIDFYIPSKGIHPNSVLFCIRFDAADSKDIYAIQLEEFSKYPEEQEVLFAPFCRYNVLGTQKEKGVPGRGIIHLHYTGCFPYCLQSTTDDLEMMGPCVAEVQPPMDESDEEQEAEYEKNDLELHETTDYSKYSLVADEPMVIELSNGMQTLSQTYYNPEHYKWVEENPNEQDIPQDDQYNTPCVGDFYDDCMRPHGSYTAEKDPRQESGDPYPDQDRELGSTFESN